MAPGPLRLLAPAPRGLDRRGRGCELRGPWGLEAAAGISTAPANLPALEAASGGRGTRLELAIDSGAKAGPQSYRLRVEPRGVRITGGGPAGLYYGVATLIQLVRLHTDTRGRTTLPGLVIDDAPDLPNRGVMLDISRDKVPRMGTLRELVVLLAGLKLNQLQLYTEHTFAYAGHEEVWRDASPLTPAEVRELDALCRRHHVELVPNQNSFGHFHRWLRHATYRPLAECPDGVVHAFSPTPEPFSLCPTDPGSLSLLAGLYDQLLPCFSSAQLNTGLDETFDLGLGRSRAVCEAEGKHRVYLRFLRQVRDLVAARGRRMQFWGDIVIEQPELIGELPGDVIALEWGYEQDHPFEEHARLLAEAGLDFYLCPGTSSWNSIGGRVDNAVATIRRAAEAGVGTGATGLLVTDWGDNGHLQPLPISYPGFLAAAAASWNVGAASVLAELAPLLDLHVLADGGAVTGDALVALGRTEAAADIGAARNGTNLFWLMQTPGPLPDRRWHADLGPGGFERAVDHLERAVSKLPAARIDRPDADVIVAELRWAAGLLTFAAHLGRARLAAGLDQPVSALPAPARAQLGRELSPLIRDHCRLWPLRFRPGGLDDSAGRLEALAAALSGADRA